MSATDDTNFNGLLTLYARYFPSDNKDNYYVANPPVSGSDQQISVAFSFIDALSQVNMSSADSADFQDYADYFAASYPAFRTSVTGTPVLTAAAYAVWEYIKSGAGQNQAPQLQKAWAPPPAHAFSQVVSRGEGRVSGTGIYCAVRGGTTGAASAPTAKTFANITDGGVIWSYLGETFTADPDAPTVAITSGGNIPAATPRFYSPGKSVFTAIGASTYERNDSWFTVIGDMVVDGTGIGHGGNGDGGFEFYTDSPIFSICFTGYIAYGVRIAVDGKFIQHTTYRPTADGVTTYATVTLKNAKPRTRVTVYFLSNFVGLPVYGVCVPSYGRVWAEKTPLKVLYTGDSFSEPEAFYSIGSHMQLAAILAAELGTVDFLGDGLGSTGFTMSATPNKKYIDRIGYISTYLPDVHVIQGSSNDQGETYETIKARVIAYISAAYALKPDCLRFITGVTGNNSAGALNTDAAISAAIRESGIPNVWFIPAATDPAGPWISAATSAYIGVDGTHPVQPGIGFIAARMGQGVRTVIRNNPANLV